MEEDGEGGEREGDDWEADQVQEEELRLEMQRVSKNGYQEKVR